MREVEDWKEKLAGDNTRQSSVARSVYIARHIRTHHLPPLSHGNCMLKTQTRAPSAFFTLYFASRLQADKIEIAAIVCTHSPTSSNVEKFVVVWQTHLAWRRQRQYELNGWLCQTRERSLLIMIICLGRCETLEKRKNEWICNKYHESFQLNFHYENCESFSVMSLEFVCA